MSYARPPRLAFWLLFYLALLAISGVCLLHSCRTTVTPIRLS